jgi:hypothetical protein
MFQLWLGHLQVFSVTHHLLLNYNARFIHFCLPSPVLLLYPSIYIIKLQKLCVSGRGGTAMNSTKLHQTWGSIPDNFISARKYRESPGITESLTERCMSPFSLLVPQFGLSSATSPLIPPSCSEIQMYVYFKKNFFGVERVLWNYI